LAQHLKRKSNNGGEGRTVSLPLASVGKKGGVRALWKKRGDVLHSSEGEGGARSAILLVECVGRKAKGRGTTAYYQDAEEVRGKREKKRTGSRQSNQNSNGEGEKGGPVSCEWGNEKKRRGLENLYLEKKRKGDEQQNSTGGGRGERKGDCFCRAAAKGKKEKKGKPSSHAFKKEERKPAFLTFSPAQDRISERKEHSHESWRREGARKERENKNIVIGLKRGRRVMFTKS